MLQPSHQKIKKPSYFQLKTIGSKGHFDFAQDNTLGYLLIGFILWPFGTFIYALINYTHKNSHIIFILFTGLFGYSMIAESDGLDLSRYLLSLSEYLKLSYLDFFRMITGTYSGETSRVSSDLYVDIVEFMVSRFTGSGAVLMLFFGLIYGFVYSKCLSLLLSFNQLKNQYTTILLICFSFMMGLDQLAGVRFGTAAYLFVAGFLFLLRNKKITGYLYLFLSVFVHFGFIPGVLLVLSFPLIEKKEKLIYGITVLSFFIPTLLQNYFLQFSSLLEGGISNKVKTYTKDVNGDNGGNIFVQTVWFVQYRYIFIYNYSYFVLVYIIFKYRQFRTNLLSKRLLLFTLLLLSLSNFTMNVPEFGSRYKFIFLMFFIGYLYQLYSLNKNSETMKYIAFGAMGASLFQIVFVLRCVLYYTPASLFFGNIGIILINNDLRTVWSIIKGI